MTKNPPVKNRVRATRRKKGMTIEQFTKRFQRARNRENFEEDLGFIRRVEAGEEVQTRTAWMLADALSVKVSVLYPFPH